MFVQTKFKGREGEPGNEARSTLLFWSFLCLHDLVDVDMNYFALLVSSPGPLVPFPHTREGLGMRLSNLQ